MLYLLPRCLVPKFYHTRSPIIFYCQKIMSQIQLDVRNYEDETLSNLCPICPQRRIII